MITRVLHFADIINRHDFIDNVIRGCNADQFAIQAATLDDRGSLNLAPARVRVANLAVPRRRSFVLAALRLRRLLRSERIDILHVHHYYPGLIALVATRGLPVHTVIGRHYSDAITQLSHGWRRRAHLTLEGLCNRAASAIVAPSSAVAAVLLAQGVPAAKIARIPYGFDFRRFVQPTPDLVTRLRALWGESPGLRLATFGRLHKEKGHRVLVDAMQILETEGIEATWLIAGDGPERGPVEALLASSPVGFRTRLLGWRTDVLELMCAADMVVQPTLHEAFSQVMVEAMAMGRPLVISDVSGVRDVVEDGLSGFVVPPRDPAALAQAIRRLSDRSTAERIGETGATRVRSLLDERRIIPQFEELYRSLTRPPASSGCDGTRRPGS